MKLNARALKGGLELVLLIVVTVGMTMLETARTPILEEAVCRHHVDARDCRENAVQARVAILNGWIENVSAVQGLLLTLPYAWLAESIDSYKLLLTGFVSSTVSVVYFFGICHLPSGLVPLNAVVFFRVFECVGGGTTMAYILLYSMLAKKNSAESRTLVMYIAGAVLLLVRAGAMALVGVLLQENAPAIGPVTVLAYLLNIPVLLWGRPPRPASYHYHQVLLVPDHSVPTHHEVTGSTTSVAEESSDGSEDEVSTANIDQDQQGPSYDMLTHVKHVLSTARNEYLGRAVLRTSFFIFGIKIIAVDVQFIQPQWSVKRFDWNFTAASYVNAYATLVCMSVLACLPFLSAALSDRLGSPQKTDIVIFRLSLFFRIVGTVAMGAAPTKVSFLAAVGVQALSAGAYDTFKSFVTGFSSATHVTELYAVISLVETVAHILSSQLWANVLTMSLDLNGSKMGMPFWFSGLLSLITLISFQIMVWQAKNSPL